MTLSDPGHSSFSRETVGPGWYSCPVRIEELIEQVAGKEQTPERDAARDALVALGAEAVGPVLAVLGDVSSPVEWYVSGHILEHIGRPAFEPVRDALAAATECEQRRRFSWAFAALKVDDPAMYLPALRHPSAVVRQSALSTFQRLGERAEPFLPALAESLADPDEEVRQRAVWTFQAAGQVAVPLLHEIRRGTGRRRAAALTALADSGGWDALEAADRAAVTRLIAIKSIGEVPEPMHLCGSWFALPTGDRSAVLDAFGLSEPMPVTMRMGAAAWNHDHHDWGNTDGHSACRRMYVSPVLDGWTLVFGRLHDDEDAQARCAELSARFGDAQWYGASCGDGWTSWCIAAQGSVVRYYDVFEPDDQIGDGHPAEAGLHLPHVDPYPEDAFDDIASGDSAAFGARMEQLQRELGIPDEAHSTDIARRLSVDPAALGERTVVSGLGVLALTECGAGGPSPRGALAI